jgi:hypothetical protein
MKQVIAVGIALLAVACAEQRTAPAADQRRDVKAERLGGEPAGAGTTFDADAGEIRPADPATFHKEPGYSPYAGRRYPERAYFGDEHVHTAWSVDAGGFGTTLGPEEATRFARGEEVTATSGQPAKLGTPLDRVAITDHSDGMGLITEIVGNHDLGTPA